MTEVPSTVVQSLLTLYETGVLALSVLAYFISDFYRKKFNQPSPRYSFLFAVILGVLLIIVSFFHHLHPTTASLVQSLLLMLCGVVIIYSAISLYTTMKKVRR